jgi:hypothetical protein
MKFILFTTTAAALFSVASAVPFRKEASIVQRYEAKRSRFLDNPLIFSSRFPAVF